MNYTHRVIVVLGDENQIRKAIEPLKGFKAITILKTLSPEKVQNVFYHNKNALYASTDYNLNLFNYNPILVNLTYVESDFNTFSISVDKIITDFPKFMDKFDIDIGDHVSEDSSKFKNASVKPCLLCNIRDGVSDRKEHILYQTKHFYVIPGLGAFFKGYLMIVPKEHIMSFAELSKVTFNEFKLILIDLRTILEAIYGKKVFAFENGSGKNGAGKHATSITHAHFHLAPTNMPVFESICKSGLNPSQIELDTLCRYSKYPYMLYGTQDDEWYICSDPDSYFPRQHPRQILADYMGLSKGEYNWRTHPHEEELEIIAAEFKDFIVKNYTKLPKWTQIATQHLL